MTYSVILDFTCDKGVDWYPGDTSPIVSARRMMYGHKFFNGPPRRHGIEEPFKRLIVIPVLNYFR